MCYMLQLTSLVTGTGVCVCVPAYVYVSFTERGCRFLNRTVTSGSYTTHLPLVALHLVLLERAAARQLLLLPQVLTRLQVRLGDDVSLEICNTTAWRSGHMSAVSVNDGEPGEELGKEMIVGQKVPALEKRNHSKCV